MTSLSESISQKHLDHARALIADTFVMDAHFDLGCDIDDRRELGAERVYADRHEDLVRSGNWDCLVSSIFVHSYQLPEMGLRKALDQISALMAEAEEQPDMIMLCRNMSEVDEANAKGRTALLLSLEGADPIGNDLSLLRIFYTLGVRSIGLTWSRRNYAADGCTFSPQREGARGGLTAFGVELLEESERLGILVDISHLNDEGVADVARFATKPFIASHSNCRELMPHARNLTDGQIRLVADSGGVIGMNCCSAFVSQDTGGRISPAGLVTHMQHIVKLVGDDFVGLGLDCCDRLADFRKTPPNIGGTYDTVPDHSHLAELAAWMINAGLSDGSIKKILGANFRRVYSEVIGDGGVRGLLC